MKTSPDVSIIIVTHNACEFLRSTLDSIAMQKGIIIETVVVDNLSTDNTLTMLQDTYQWVTVVKRDTSTGFSAGNNEGLKKTHADLVLFFNPDITFTTPFDLQKLCDKYRMIKNVGILTPRVNLVVNGEIDETCHRGFPTPWAALTHFTGLEKLFPDSTLFAQYTASYLGYDSEHEVDAVGGMCMLISRKIGDTVGWWDEDYPFYGEDLDLCYRVREKGFKNYYWPEVIVKHYKGVTTGMSRQSRHVSVADKQTTRRVKGWSILAMETFYKKHYAKKYPLLVTWVVLTGVKLLRMRRLLST